MHNFLGDLGCIIITVTLERADWAMTLGCDIFMVAWECKVPMISAERSIFMTTLEYEKAVMCFLKSPLPHWGTACA